ncbi:STAS domain-containing protein [Nocardiopsis coralliicola]
MNNTPVAEPSAIPIAPERGRPRSVRVVAAREPGAGAVTVAVAGPLDRTTSRAVREQLAAALRPGTGAVALDLAQVTACDAAGVALLVGTRRRAALLGLPLSLTDPSDAVLTALAAARLADRFGVHPAAGSGGHS